MKQLSISRRIILSSLFFFAIAAFILVIFMQVTVSRDVKQLLIAEQQEKAQLLVTYASKALEERKILLMRLAPLLQDGGKLLDEASMAQLLDGIVLVRQTFNGGLMVADAAGIGVGEAPKNSGRIGLNISQREHIQEARKTKQPVITQPLIASRANRPSFFINVPILSETEGVLGFLIGITFLEVNNFLVPSGQVLRSDELLYIIDPVNKLIVTSHDFSLSMQPLPPHGIIPLIDAALTTSQSGAITERNGTKLLYASAVMPQMGWIVVKALPEEKVLAPVAHLVSNLALSTLGLLALFALLLISQLGRILAPLRQSIMTIDSMVNEREAFQAIPVHVNDEVGQLVGAFNRLLASRDEQRQRLYLATSGTGIGIWDYDILQNKLTWDDNMYRLYGLSKSNFGAAYEAWQNGLHPDDAASAHALIQQAIQGGKEFKTEFRVIHPDGITVRWIQADACVIRNEEGKAVRMIGTNLDITERKRVEMMKNQFISTVSHELRTPLTSIRGAITLIDSGQLGQLSPEATQMIKIAKSNSDRLTLLINDLLDIEKIASGRMEFAMKRLEVGAIAVESINTHQTFAQEHSSTFVLMTRDDNLFVNADEKRLQQVIANLLSNAAKFSPAGSTVEIHCTREGQNVRVAIRDYGSGIPDEFRERIFKRFSQADSSDTRPKGGTGLGLAISREIIHKMGGTIGFDSVYGEGSTFYFTLPFVE
ncbi:sensor histidine kinase [Chrysiogenes arsenatis]|uniref:sensor histidine kinase n=1 Tax=Chrysiogenes arsenatis TaxID=309797 RepID=UPI00041FF3E3|nr:sensor histidine kinase [Chrysiogenes arsenatis]